MPYSLAALPLVLIELGWPGWHTRNSNLLLAGRYRESNPDWGRDFPCLSGPPKAHLAFCTMDTGSFLGVKSTESSGDHPPPSSAEVENGFELYLCCLSVPALACHGVNLIFCHCNRTLGRPPSLDCLEKLIIPCPCWGWNHNYSVIQPVAWSLHWLGQECIKFPKIQDSPWNSRHQKDDMKQGPQWRFTKSKYHHTTFSSHSNIMPGVCAPLDLDFQASITMLEWQNQREWNRQHKLVWPVSVV